MEKQKRAKSERDLDQTQSPTIYINQDIGEQARKILYNRLNLNLQYAQREEKSAKRGKSKKKLAKGVSSFTGGLSKFEKQKIDSGSSKSSKKDFVLPEIHKQQY